MISEGDMRNDPYVEVLGIFTNPNRREAARDVILATSFKSQQLLLLSIQEADVEAGRTSGLARLQFELNTVSTSLGIVNERMSRLSLDKPGYKEDCLRVSNFLQYRADKLIKAKVLKGFPPSESSNLAYVADEASKRFASSLR